MIKTMVKTSKLAFIAFEILALMVVFAMPLSIRGASCILLADIIVLIVIVQQIRARLEDVPLFFSILPISCLYWVELQLHSFRKVAWAAI